MPLPDEKLPGLTEAELGVLKKVFSSPLDIPAEWKAWLIAYLEANPPDLPINQSIGFVNLVSSAIDSANAAAAAASAAAAAAQAAIFYPSLGGSSDLGFAAGTPNSGSGPSISGLADGNYIILAGFDSSGVVSPQMVVSPGGMTVTVQARAALLALTGGTITSALSGTGGGAGGSIANPWLLAMRYS